MSRCAQVNDAAAWALGALDESEADQFRAHLATCAICRAEVDDLQLVTAALPMAVDQHAPPPGLGDRIMATVTAEAELQRVAEAPAREPQRAPRRRGWSSFGSLRAPVLAGGALAAIGVGLVVGLSVSGSSGPSARTTEAEVTTAGAHATFVVDGTRARLRLTGMPAPAAGKVYEVWVKAENATAPRPTDTLFSPSKAGTSDVAVPIAVHQGDEVLVTAEPDGGSRAPTSPPVIVAMA